MAYRSRVAAALLAAWSLGTVSGQAAAIEYEPPLGYASPAGATSYPAYPGYAGHASATAPTGYASASGATQGSAIAQIGLNGLGGLGAQTAPRADAATESGGASMRSSQGTPHVEVRADVEESLAMRLIRTATEQIGQPYRWGGLSPFTGFDCSGLVIYAANKALGFELPRTSHEIARAQAARSIPLGELKPGDLVFFNTLRRAYSHVGIYLGQGRFVHAPNRKSVVRIDELHQDYWKSRFNGARRLVTDAPKLR
jgi:cell wall-associated NlpC family hydrolase